MIRVAIADDHALVREGLRRMIGGSDTLEVVGEAADGAEAIALVRELCPDVLLLDISMPRKDGIEATSEITAMGVETRILILSMHADEQYALRTLRAGAHGFIWKGSRFEELVKAIAEVAAGNRYLPPEIEQAFADKYLSPDADKSPVELLSKREFQVMCYLANGMTNREIAQLLEISIKTVDTHRGHVLKKLKLRNNSDITRFAIQNGYIQY
jgi:two-component system, NarL family, invasion response regulator UvrY